MTRLSEKEWKVLDSLWDNEGAELKTIVDSLHQHTGWNKNTVLTYLTRMENKGLVRIDKEHTPHTYHSNVDRKTCQKQESRSFLDTVYQGSAADLITAFLKEEKMDEEEIAKLKQMLDEMEV